MEYKDVEIRCPNCKESLDHDCDVPHSYIELVKGPEFFSTEFSHLKELWYCPNCDNYFEVYYKFDKIVPLIKKEDDVNMGKSSNNKQ